MFRRAVLALAMVAALGVGSLGVANQADAHGYGNRCGRGYGGYYGAYYQPYYAPYPVIYQPRPRYVGYYGGGYGDYPRHHHHHHDHDRGGVSFSIGF